MTESENVEENETNHNLASDSNDNDEVEKHTSDSPNGKSKTPYQQIRPQSQEKARTKALEVVVDRNIEKAMKVLKRKLIKEGLFKELKARRYYEKPSQRKKRKLKESMKKLRKEAARRRKNQVL